VSLVDCGEHRPKPIQWLLANTRVVPHLGSGALPELQPIEDFSRERLGIAPVRQFEHWVNRHALAVGTLDLALR
jgi:hypothetical protein